MLLTAVNKGHLYDDVNGLNETISKLVDIINKKEHWKFSLDTYELRAFEDAKIIKKSYRRFRKEQLGKLS